MLPLRPLDGGYHELYEAEQKQEQENEEEEAEDGEMDSGTVDGATTAPDQVVPIEPSLTEVGQTLYAY